MKFDSGLTDQAVFKLIGGRLAEIRLAMNMTQEQLADQAGLGLRTVQRLELGEAATQLSGFIRVCRVLGLVERFEMLLPETVPGPMQQLQMQGRRRQRASGQKLTKPKPGKWTWRDKKS